MSSASRFGLFVPPESLSDATTLASEVFGDELLAAAETCSVPLASPQSGKVLLGGSGGLSAAESAAFEEAVLASSVLVAFRWDARDGTLWFTNHQASASAVGSSWGWDACLAALGVDAVTDPPSDGPIAS